MAATYTLIESYTVGAGGASSVTLGSGGTIPQTYTDLLLFVSARTTGSADPTIRIRINGDSGTNYSYIAVYGSGSSTASYTQAGPGSGNTFLNAGYATNTGYTANVFSNTFVYLPNYTGSTNKSWLVDGVPEDNATDVLIQLFAGQWSNTSAITSLTLSQGTNNYAQYSSAYLYGIKNS